MAQLQGDFEIQKVLSQEEWRQKKILDRCDIVKKDGEIKRYPTKKIAGVQYYDRREQEALKALEREWKKAGGEDVAYANYLQGVANYNTQSAGTYVDTGKGESDIKNRPLYFVGGAILIFIVVMTKILK